MKPSESTSTGASAIRVMVMVVSSRRDGDVLAARRHGRADAGDVAPGEKHVPVDPLEGELAQVVDPRLAQERQAELGREAPRQRLDLVVEVDQQRLVEARLDEAVGVSVVAGLELAAGEEAGDVLGQHLGLEVRDRSGLRGREVGRVAESEHVGLRLRLERGLVRRDEAERVAEARPALDVLARPRAAGR